MAHHKEKKTLIDPIWSKNTSILFDDLISPTWLFKDDCDESIYNAPIVIDLSIIIEQSWVSMIGRVAQSVMKACAKLDYTFLILMSILVLLWIRLLDCWCYATHVPVKLFYNTFTETDLGRLKIIYMSVMMNNKSNHQEGKNVAFMKSIEWE